MAYPMYGEQWKSVFGRKFTALNIYIWKEGRLKISVLKIWFQTLLNNNIINLNKGEIVKIRAKKSQFWNKSIVGIILKPRFFEKSNKVDKPLMRPIKNKEKTG